MDSMEEARAQIEAAQMVSKAEENAIDPESPEEVAAMTLAFTCSLGNQQARAIVAIIKNANVPFLVFNKRAKRNSK